MTVRYEVDVVVDVDEFGNPSGVELIGLRARLGASAADQFEELTRNFDVRVSYDRDADAVAIGTGIATGSRVSGSIPRRASAWLDASGRLLSIDVPMR